MQTFLPLPSFVDSAQVLDFRRLGKQRIEAKQILNVLEGKTLAWSHHPAVKMWRGYEAALSNYYIAICARWIELGYHHTMPILTYDPGAKNPDWLGDESFHASHRSNLLRKNPDWYGQWKWKESPDLPYIWPGSKF